MRQLLAKDVRLIAPYLWVIVPAHVLWCAQAFLVPDLYFWMSVGAALVWTVAVALIEWQLGTDRLVASLPVTRATIVKARYASALGAVALGAVLFVAYGHGLMAVAADRLAGRWPGAPMWASADGVAAFLVVGCVVTIGFLPFYFRAGFPVGAALFSVSAGVVLFAAIGLNLLGGSTGRLADAAGGAATTLRSSDVIRGWLVSLAASMGAVPAALAVLGVGALLGVGSVRLSIRFYEGRDL
jgi:hypothetical protein